MALMEANEDRLVDIWTNSLHLRLAETLEEVEAAQTLRYRIFYEGTAAKATEEVAALKRDFDAFDDYCDHLLVFDRSRGDGPEGVIGTYRLMRREAAERCGRFYTEDEYDIANLLNFPGDILELGRSCIAEKFRNGPTLQLLWRGVVEYILAHDVGLLFGCASLPGVEPDRLALQLSFLYHHHLAPPALRTWARPERYVPMNRIPPEEISAPRAMQQLPPLLKGYLRVGGFIGEGAVIDYDFGTTDVCVMLKTEWVTDRYYRHYLRDDAGKDAGVP